LGRHHALSGAVVWLAGYASVAGAIGVHDPRAAVFGTPVCAAAALIPDIDHEGSLIARSLGPVSRLVAWGVRAACGHRGLTHTGVSALVVGMVSTVAAGFGLGWSWWWLGLAVGIGHLVHILGDACTRAGVPLLWPLPVGRLPRRGRSGRYAMRMVGLWEPLRFRTGGRVEVRFVGPLLILSGLAAAWFALA
jgi:membrane-bound metal-dependent hydrolase YbcI (DUF457 family)